MDTPLSITRFLKNPASLESSSEGWNKVRTMTHPQGIPGWSFEAADWSRNSDPASLPDLGKFRVVRPVPSPFDSGGGFAGTTFDVPATMTLTDALKALLAALSAIGCFFEVAVAPGEVRFSDIVVHSGHRVGGLVYVSDFNSSSPSPLVLTFTRRHGERRSWQRLVYDIAIKAKFALAQDMPRLLQPPGPCSTCKPKPASDEDAFGYFVDPDEGGGCDNNDNDDDLFGGVFLPFPDTTGTADTVLDMLEGKFKDEVQTAAHLLAEVACCGTCLRPAEDLSNVPKIVQVYMRYANTVTAAPTGFDPLAAVTCHEDIAATLATVLGNIAAAASTAMMEEGQGGRLDLLGRPDFVDSLLAGCRNSDPLQARAYLRCVAQLCEAHPRVCGAITKNGSALKACDVCKSQPFLASHAESAKQRIEAAAAKAASSSSTCTTTTATTTACSVS